MIFGFLLDFNLIIGLDWIFLVIGLDWIFYNKVAFPEIMFFFCLFFIQLFFQLFWGFRVGFG
jgi:hypothetical protein